MATISLHHVNASLEGCCRQGVNDRALLTRAGINPVSIDSDVGRIHTEQVGRLFRLIQQELNDEFMGFTKSPCKYGAFATLCDLTRHCQTLGELLEKSVVLYNLITSDLKMTLSITEHAAKFSFTFTDPTLDDQHFLAEFLLVIWHRFPSWYIGEAIRLREIHFAHHSPAHHKELKIMFPGRLRFNQPNNCLIFDTSYLQKPLLRKERELDMFLSNHPLDMMTIPGVDGSLEARVERLVANHHSGNLVFPKAEKIAYEMGMGKVTLYRKLQHEGTSYQRIKDNIRRERSIELLEKNDLSVDRISEIIGFSEARSFTRAFRTWTGLSPRQYRTLSSQNKKEQAV